MHRSQKPLMGLSMLFAFFLIFLPLLTLLRTKFAEAKHTTSRQLPPSPPKLPIIGNLHQFGSLPHQSFSQLAKRYGPVILLHLGRLPVVVISSAEAAREVLKVQDLVCCSRPCFAGSGRLSYNFKDVAFTPYSEYWRYVRKLVILEIFSVKRVQSFRFIRENEVPMLIKSISESSGPFNLTKKLFEVTANITFKMSFGYNYRGTDFDRKRFHELVPEVESVVGSLSAAEYFPYVGWIVDLITGHHARTERVFQELDGFFEHVINEHLKPERVKDHEDLIDVMLKIKKDQAESGNASFTKDNIKGVLLNQFLGGIDTTAITVNWAMAELAKKPNLMKKAQDEIRNCIGKKGVVTEDDLNRFEYLKMVIKETLRLHPPAPLLVARETMSECKIDHYNIHPNTILYVNAWAIGRDPKYWEDPEEFNPERFVDNEIDYRGHHFEFVPFGGGRRVCPGIYMGMVTVEIILANLLYWFKWKLPDGVSIEDLNMEERAGVSLTVTKKVDLCLDPVNYIW